MAYEDVIKVVNLDVAFSQADKDSIIGVIREAYEESSIAREMFDNWVATGRSIDFRYGEGRFDAWDGVVTLDMKELDKASYINFYGKAVQDYPFTAIIHELGHALKALEDNWSTDKPAGDNQNFVNTIYVQAGYQEQLAYMAYDARGVVIERGVDYTDGMRIDNAWVKKWSWLPNDYDVTDGGKYLKATNDLIMGSADSNVLKSGAGNDFVYGLGGRDQLFGNTGDDRLSGGEGADLLDGGTGFDFASYVHASAGVTASLTDPSRNTGEAAGDSFVSIEGLIGSKYTDRLSGDGRANQIEGRDGDDFLNGAGGNDVLHGGAGNDRLDGGTGADRLVGGSGNDIYFVDNVRDTAEESAGGGWDIVHASSNYTLQAGQAIEAVQAAEGTMWLALSGNEFGNHVIGNDGVNHLFGQGGDDRMSGGGGNDVLDGGAGWDNLTGGDGRDRFVFSVDIAKDTTFDTITDFAVRQDSIWLDIDVFTALGPVGGLAAAAFQAVAGGKARDASDRVIYDTSSGDLFYDADGSGAGAAMRFAHLNPGLALASSDFQLFA